MRSLYQCSQAKIDYLQYVYDYEIYCSMEHYPLQRDGVTLTYADLKAGGSLDCDTCRGCKDFDYMDVIPEEEDRGWK
ncbi:hypothetical protein LCGC14_1761300 [marine sediment metagenome]|uniref:Uncharacterized protein n=1 Tax=marine sediment metagenome TaxID=412755 RepID=A0A0F9H0Y7_9ZZZZ